MTICVTSSAKATFKWCDTPVAEKYQAGTTTTIPTMFGHFVKCK